MGADCARAATATDHRAVPNERHRPGDRWVQLYHNTWYTYRVAQAISVRLDDDAQRALRTLEAAGLSRSEAIRSSLIASADRLRQRSALADEVAALEADEADRDEMLAVAELMESLRGPG